ncbi:MAG: T9SS type A sorting domain-containing protein [Bacteroidales bacterium]
MLYTDSLLFPDSTYEIKITAFFEGDETFPSSAQVVFVPIPENLEPQNLDGAIELPNENDVTLFWEEPNACLPPDGYNIYRNGNKINSNLVIDLTFIDPDIIWMGFIEYNINAVYYFGESAFSNSFYVINPGLEDNILKSLQIFPNPASDQINIVSNEIIEWAELTTLVGKIVVRKEINSKEYQLNVSALNPGIYILKLENKGISIKKIVVR